MTVMTVTGPVAADDLGVTLPHEHVFIDLTREYRGNGLLNDSVAGGGRAAGGTPTRAAARSSTSRPAG